MAKIKVGINGFGRIGRMILRAWYKRSNKEFDIVAINDLDTPENCAHLLRYDSVHGRFGVNVRVDGNTMVVGDYPIQFYKESDPSKIGWDVDLVIDSTGKFTDRKGLSQHIKGRTKKVILCAPGKEIDGTFVIGINHKNYDNSKHNIISNASCTTNCLAPIVKVLNDRWGIECGQMTTIHSYTGDQRLIDTFHKDKRRARAAALSMIPTTTGAAKAIGEVIPDLKGKLDGYAIRVPTPNVSVVDLTAILKKPATKEEINKAMKEASEGELKGILGYSDEPLVSVDFQGTSESSIFDSELTKVVDKTVKVVSWYDNEYGFSNRVVDLVNHVGKQL